MAVVLAVPSYDVVDVWDLVRPWIGKALRAEKVQIYGFSDIYRSLLTKEMQLWLADDMCCVTQILVYPRAKVCVILLLGGSHPEEWIHGIREIEDWARQLGCVETRIHGRRGWEKLLKPYDYVHESTVLVKELLV